MIFILSCNGVFYGHGFMNWVVCPELYKVMLCYLNCFIQLVSFTVLLLRSVFLVVHMCSFLKKGLKLYFYIVIYIL